MHDFSISREHAYARMMALATLLDDDRAVRAREAIVVLADAPARAESEAA